MFEFFKKKQPSQKIKDKVASLSVKDDALQAYKYKAQDEISYLIEFMETHENDDEFFKYAVKTNFKQGDNTEHMWVQVNEFKDGRFIGKLANRPATVTSLEYGDPVNVLREDVEDWILQDHLTNTKVGGFSSGYIRNKADNNQ